MVVCKFFQAGHCRYGQNCRFEHAYSSKYSYHAPQIQNPAPAQNPEQQLVNQAQTDIQAAIKGGQWLLSGYSPFKEKPSFPGLTDLSPEEVRLFIYEAKASNTLDQAIAYINNLTQEAKSKYEQIAQPSTTMVQTLRSICKGESVPSPFSTTQPSFGNTAASSVFHTAAQNTFGPSPSNAASIFSQKANTVFNTDSAKSVFAQASQNVFGPQVSPNQTHNIFASNADPKSVFGQAVQTENRSVFSSPESGNAFASTPPAKSIFGEAVQTIDNTQSVFAQSPDTAKSVFGQANQNIFAPQSQNVNVFAPDPFQQNSASVFQTNQPASNAFGASSVFQQAVDDSNNYSSPEDLSAEDLAAYQAVEFKLGFVPELPPPKALCVK